METNTIVGKSKDYKAKKKKKKNWARLSIKKGPKNAEMRNLVIAVTTCVEKNLVVSIFLWIQNVIADHFHHQKRKRKKIRTF